MKYLFRIDSPNRTCTKIYSDPLSYKKYLREDFNCRCAYCNLKDTDITSFFEVDHFVPKKAFDGVWPALLTTYENLIYSCAKCNRTKSSQFSGDLSKRVIENKLFYDPVKYDYNKIFYRDDYGSIKSDDEKGRKSIICLKLYSRIHNLAWICEQIKLTIDRIKFFMDGTDTNSEKYKILEKARMELLDIEREYKDLFIANYNENPKSI